MPPERIRFQAEQAPAYREALVKWERMTGEQRVSTWQDLLHNVPTSLEEVLPICVRCGQCCKRGSPSLHAEDLALLREEKIPWDKLVTLRRGEPVRSPESAGAFYLGEERIKLREKAGSGECVFFDSGGSSCAIYSDRPLQCRVQACWDAEAPAALDGERLLTRRDIFAEVGVLLDLLDEHDARCSFEKLREAFEDLRQSAGKSIDTVVDLLAFEEHFRDFVCEKLHIPVGIGDLVFGRRLADRVRLFGFKVLEDADGGRTLLAEEG